MENVLLPLEKEKEQLLENYAADEISFYTELVQAANSHVVTNGLVYSVLTREDGSNG